MFKKLSIAFALAFHLHAATSFITSTVEQRKTVNIKEFAGADPTGAASSQAAIDAAYAKLSSTDGGEITIPAGKWKFNLVITKPNVTISGVSHMRNTSGTPSFGSFLIADDTSKPVIQVGNDTQIVRGAVIRNLSLDGSNGGVMGVYFAGGAFECVMEDCAVTYFDTGIKVQGGTSFPASCIYFDHVFGHPDLTANNSRGWLIANPANYPTSWTTEIDIFGCHWDGPSAGTNSYVMEVDSAEVKIENTYLDVHDGHGVKLSHTVTTPLPLLDAINSNLDAGSSSAVAIEGYTNDRNFNGLSTLNFQVNGQWKELDGTLIPPLAQPIKTILRKSSATRGTFILLNQSSSDGSSLIQQIDAINSKYPQIYFQNGFIRLRCDPAGAVTFGDTNGAVKAQINPTGDIYLYGSNTTADGRPLQVDSSNHLISFSPTNSITFALSDMTTALTTGTVKNYWIPKLAGTIKYVRGNVSTVSSSGLPTFDIIKNGSSILSTKITIDASERTSDTAATAPVLSSTSFAADDYITFSITTAGTGATGAQVEIGYTTP